MIVEAMGWAFIALVAAAAVQDVAQLRISNLFSILLILLFALRVWLVGDFHILPNLAAFALALLLGIGLFACGWLGGGDAKLLAAAALWFDPGQGLGLVAAVTMGGGLLALLFIFIRRMLPASLYARSGWPALKPRGPIPYGVAIAAGAILSSQWMGFHPVAPVHHLPPLQLALSAQNAATGVVREK